MAFPDTPRDVKTELLLDGEWVDAVDTGNGVLVRDPITINYGRADWATSVDSGAASLSLANRDGRWSPDYASGAHYGHLRRNIPTRIGVGTGDVYLGTNGLSKDVCYTADVAGTGGGAPDTPVVEGTTTTTVTSFTTTHTFNLPATVNVGDRLLLSACFGHNSATTTALSAWTLVHSDTRHTFDGWKVYEIEAANSTIATALAGASVAFTTTEAVKSSCVVTRTSGVRSGGEGTAWDYLAGTYAEDQATTVDPPNLGPAWGADANLWLTLAAADKGATNLDVTTAPSGYTLKADTGGTANHGFITGVASKASSSSTDNPGVWTLTATAFASALTFVYRPLEDPSSDGVLDISGDIDLRIEFQLHADLVDIDEGGDRVRLAHKSSGADGWEWEMYYALGYVVTTFYWYTSAGALKFVTSESTGAFLPFEIQHDRVALRVTLDVDNGASGHDVRFYTSDTVGGTWTQLGLTVTTSGTTSIKTNDATVEVAGNPNDATHIPIPGKVFAFQMRNGIAGTIVANPDFTAQTVGATSFTDSVSRTWHIGPGAALSDTRYRLHGELASIPTRWNVDGSDVWAPIEVSGLFRRLRQGKGKLASSIRRGIERSSEGIVQYWPCEEQGGGYITRFGAAIGKGAIVVTNDVPDTGANTAFVGSDPLPTFGDSVWSAYVDPYTSTGSWQVRWLQSIPDGYTDAGSAYGVVPVQVWTNDIIWEVCYRDDNGGDLRVSGIRGGVGVYDSGWFTFGATGSDWRMSLSVTQNGSDLDVSLQARDPNSSTAEAGGFNDTAAVAGLASDVILIQFNKDLDIDGWSAGHVTLQNSTTGLETLADELDAHDGEPAGERIQRLCREEGLAYRIQGDPADTELMGPQRPGTLMELLEECAATDLGVLFEPREALAIGYRTRLDMTSQDAALTLDYSAGEVAAPLELDRDDQDFANDVTVTNWTGATARAYLDDDTAMSVAQPPTGAGTYEQGFDVNALDENLVAIAALRLKLTAVDEPRVSRLAVALHHPAIVANPTLADAIIDTNLGDLVVVTDNLPVALGGAAVRQLIQGTTETIGSFEHTIDYRTTPASPWSAVPDAIDDLSALGGVEQVLLTWTEPDNDGDALNGYDIERSALSAVGGFAALDTIDPATSYIDTTGTVDTQYWYRVRATNDAGDGAWSNVVSALSTDTPDPPAAISNLDATAATESVVLTWSAPSSTETITSYDVQRSVVGSGGPWTDVVIDLAPATTYTNTTLAAGSTYWYRVRATSSEGDGPWSNVDSAVPTAAAISIVGGTEFDGTSSATTHAITLPTGIQANDLICIWSSTQSSTSDGAPTATGFTQRYSQGHASSFRPLVTLLYKKAAGTESGTSITLTWGTSCDANMVAVVFRGVHTTTPFDQTEPSSTSGGSNPNPASITTVTDNAWVIHAIAGNHSTTMPTPTISTGYTTAYSQVPDLKSIVVAYKLKATAGADDGSAWTWSTLDNHTSTVTALRPAASSGGSAPSTGTAAPTVPTFTSTVTITAGQNVKSLIEAQPAGTHITLAAGTHTNCENVKLKSNMHIRLATGCILEGSGKGYCFRPESATTTGVKIGGDPSGTRPIIRNYGLGTSNQDYGAIMGRTDEPLNLYPSEPAFIYTDVESWFIYHLDLKANSSNGIVIGSNWTVYDVETHGHTVTGIYGDRIVGGLIHSCVVYYNALAPAGGASSNGANIKLTWVNGDLGRTAITPTDRTKAQLIISNCVFEAFDRFGGAGLAKIGVWCDLDCKDVLIEYNTFDDHSSTSIFAEGCNDIEAAYNTIRDSNGYGNAAGENFVNGALCAGESQNCNFHHNTLIRCSRAMVNRMSLRLDWYTSDGSNYTNYAWSAGPRYWITNTGRGTSHSSTAQAKMWTTGNRFEDNTLIDCGRVMINEGSNGGGMNPVGATPNDLVFDDNDYSGSPSIQFFNKSNTVLANFAAWQALGYDV